MSNDRPVDGVACDAKQVCAAAFYVTRQPGWREDPEAAEAVAGLIEVLSGHLYEITRHFRAEAAADIEAAKQFYVTIGRMPSAAELAAEKAMLAERRAKSGRRAGACEVSEAAASADAEDR